ncbi:hypothetical protein JXI42_14325 [bacterium]|nr:hypothetical protein [bacterium]
MDTLVEILEEVGSYVDIIDSTSIDICINTYHICYLPYPDYHIGFTTEHIREIQNYVYYGGLIIVTSDHSHVGTLDSAISLVNNLLTDSVWNIGLISNYDCAYDPTDFYYGLEGILIHQFEIHPYTNLLDTIVLDYSGSISISGQGRAIARGDEDTYRDTRDSVIVSFPIVLAISHYGIGVILLISDCNLFNPDPYLEDSIPFLRHYKNIRFALSIFDCATTPHFYFQPSIHGFISCGPGSEFSWDVSISNYGYINPELLELSVNEHHLTTGSEYVEVFDSSFLVAISQLIDPKHGDTINLCIENIVDVDSFWPFDSFSYIVVVDYEAPVFSEPFPPHDTAVDWFDSISIEISDSLAGMDTSSLILIINGDTFTIAEEWITYSGSRLVIHQSAGDSIFLAD